MNHVSHQPIKRAKNADEIRPLIDLCKNGNLFDVQTWINDGKPINPPEGARIKTPLQIAIETGFHSLVQVLIEGGAEMIDGSFNALQQALYKRCFDLVKLLVNYGTDVKSVDMFDAFDTWDPKIMEYFIEQGADPEENLSLAYAFIDRIRSALGVFMRHKDRFPSFREQVNTALRYHCKEWNLKWVSLMLWAGGDPFSRGKTEPADELDPDEEPWSALELAAFYGHAEILKLKPIKVDPDHPDARKILKYACMAKNADFLQELLNQGVNPANHEDRGSGLIDRCVQSLQCALDSEWFRRHMYSSGRFQDIDTPVARERLRMVELMIENGAKWTQTDRKQINEARRSLLKMDSSYTLELVRIMAENQGCSLVIIEDLLRTPAIKKHLDYYSKRLKSLIKKFS